MTDKFAIFMRISKKLMKIVLVFQTSTSVGRISVTVEGQDIPIYVLQTIINKLIDSLYFLCKTPLIIDRFRYTL